MMRVTKYVLCFALASRMLIAQRDAGITAFNAGHYSEALKYLSTTAKNDEIGQLYLGLSLAATGDCRSALPLLSQQPLSVLGGIASVKCYASIGNEALEFSTLQKLEERFPNDADVLYLSATQHMKAFNNATFAMFQRTPSSYRVHQLSAEIFEIESKFDDAIAEYRKAIALNPNAPDLHFRLGRALLLRDHNPETLALAADEFRSELKLSPEDASCEFQLGQIAQVQTQTSAAKNHFENALKLSPNFVQALLSLGKIDTAEKNYPGAIELLNKASSLEPLNEPVHYALLTAYRDAGQMDKAKAEKQTLDRLQKPQTDEFTDFLNRLGEKPPQP